ncbi:IPT/TIG domain protein [Phycisphaerae bacterium RAS2]|nr:IPT/TIG domain protein [Phycisphaerae bacterium RAS2]
MNRSRIRIVAVALLVAAVSVTAGMTGDGCNISLDNSLKLSPVSGPTSGGTELTVIGQNFAPDTAVLFGDTAAPTVNFLNSGLLTVITPAHAAGVVDVKFRQNGVITVILPQAFTFIEPQVGLPPMTFTSIAPNTGATIGGTRVTILGANFEPGMVVLFGGFLGTNVAVVNSSVISVDAPAQGPGLVNVVLIRPDGNTLTLADAFAFQQSPVRVPGGPRVVSAISTSNTTVRVTFNESVDASAADPSNYSIVQLNVQPEAGVLIVTDAIPSADGTSVSLTTLPQNELTYLLTVTNIKDVDGNPLAPPDILVNPTQTTFAGTPPIDGGPDTDGDGLSDNEEQRGWVVFVRLTNGQVVSRDVTSDPTRADTDNDGLTDGEEKAIGIDPRSKDTDGDQVQDEPEWNDWYSDPTDQDSDQDGLSDSLDLYFKTSPILADTDGDQISDSDEITASNRNPRISDLPKPRISIGNIALNLDVRFSYTDAMGNSQTVTESQGSTLTKGNETTLSTSDEDSTKASIEISNELEVSVDIPKGGGFKNTFGLKAGFEQGHTTTVSEESKQSSEQAFEQSLSTSATVDVSRSVTREVVDASVLVDVTIQNVSTIAFTIDNLEVTALQQNPQNRKQFLPVASLRPQNPNLGPINLGPLGLVSERGPFVFQAVQVFPQQVQDLLKNPRGLILKLANFDITDELGRNFAFTSQTVFDRTAGISIDYGDGVVESFRVATHSTFDADGRSNGITMAYALQDILKLKFGNVIRDGGNLLTNTTASGDDVQVKAPGSAATIDQVLITAGPNGVLDTVPAGDDYVGGTGYEVTQVLRDVDGVMTPVDILTRVKNTKSGFLDDPLTPPGGSLVDLAIDETRTFWVVFSNGALEENAPNFNDIVLRANDQFAFAFVQDKDSDQVYAQEEFMYGSSDKNPNTDGCPDDDVSTPAYDGTCPGPGVGGGLVPFDLLTDYQEIKEGWLVTVEGQPSRKVYSDPVQPDSDGDKLFDHEERDCQLDPRQRDTDEDGLSDYEELAGYNINEQSGLLVFNVPLYAGLAILDGGNGIPETTAGGDDVYMGGATGFTKGDIVILPGANLALDSTPTVGGDDFVAAAHPVVTGCIVTSAGLSVEGYATDPLNRDTDGDGIFDGAERKLKINPNNPADGAQYRDADGDGVADFFEVNGFETVVNGSTVTYTSDPFDPDSDDDRLPDLLEHLLGSNPMNADTDGDGLPDFDEFDGPDTCVTTAVPCGDFGAGWGEFMTLCADADNCTFTLQVLTDFGSQRYGTNPKAADTDGDGLNDNFEVIPYTIMVEGAPVMVMSDVFSPNTDTDNWNDKTEYDNGTNPTLNDTDSDGLRDDLEGAVCAGSECRSPNYADQKITMGYTQISISGDCDEDTDTSACGRYGEFSYDLRVKGPGSTTFDVLLDVAAHEAASSSPDCNCDSVADGCFDNQCSGRIYRVNGGVTLNVTGGFTLSYIGRYGEVVEFAGRIRELEGCDQDGVLRYRPDVCQGDCGFMGGVSNTTTASERQFTVPVTTQALSWARDVNDDCGTLQDVDWSVSATLAGE